MNFLKKLERSSNFWFLLITSVAFFLMRLPSFFEPYWYGDEGVYEVLGFGMRHGRLLYQGVWDNKPPLLYVIYALFDGNQPQVRFSSFIVGLVAVYFFFALTKQLFENKRSVYIATGFFTLFLGLPFLEGNIANAENFMILPAVASMYFITKMIQEKKYHVLSLFGVGLLLGVSFLTKVVGVFDFASACILLCFVEFARNKKAIFDLIKQLVIFSIGFFIPLSATVGFFTYKGILSTFIQSAFLSNVGYVNYGNQFIIPQGFLILKLLLLTIALAIIFIYRHKLSLAQLFVYVWLPFSLYNAFFSGRPYTHYTLVLLGSLSLFVGIIFEKRLKILHTIFLIAVLILLAKSFWFYGKVIWYYQNFAQFTLGQKSISQYQSFFDKGVPRDYAIAQYLNLHLAPSQHVFIWTNSAQIYYLLQRNPIGRYTVAYHMALNKNTLMETATAMQQTPPDAIVVLPNAPAFPFSVKDYRLRVGIDGGLIYEKLF